MGQGPAQGAAHRIFLLPLKSAHQQQGRGIPACDQKYQRGRAQEWQQNSTAVAIEFGGQRLNPRSDAFKVVVGSRLPFGDDGEFRLRLL